MPPLAQTNPCGVSVMSTPFVHADDAARLAQDDLDLAGVAVAALGELDRLGAGLDGGQVDDGALGLRHDLLGDDEHVIVGERQRARRPLDRVADERRRGRRRCGSRGCPSSARTRDRRVGVSRHRGRSGARVDFDEDEVVGRVEVDGERAIELDVGRAGRRGRGSMGVAGCPARTRSR